MKLGKCCDRDTGFDQRDLLTRNGEESGSCEENKMKQSETISMWEDIASTGMLQRTPKGRFLIMIFSFSGSSPMSSPRIPQIVVVQLFSIISS